MKSGSDVCQQLSDEDIVGYLRSGDQRLHNIACECLHKKENRRIVGFVMRNSGTQEDGEDFYLNAISVLYTNIAVKQTYKPTGSLGGYLFQIARNLWLAELRRREKENNMKDAMRVDTAVNPEEVEEVPREVLVMRHCLERLRPACRRLLTLFYEGMTYKDIADILGEKLADPTGTLKSRKSRCMTSLRQCIQSHLNK